MGSGSANEPIVDGDDEPATSLFKGIPHCKDRFDPQDHTCPDSVRAKACQSPAAMLWMGDPVTDGNNRSINTGFAVKLMHLTDGDFLTLPLPSLSSSSSSSLLQDLSSL